MIVKKHKIGYLVLMLLMSVLMGAQWATPALAQEGYTLDWWTVDGGGATSSSTTGYALGGTIGQPDAGQLSGGDYVLGGGFWGGGPLSGGSGAYEVYLPLVLRN